MSEIDYSGHESFILTGATGFLGSHIMAALLLKGKGVVVLGRTSGGEPLKERIRKLLLFFAIEHLEGLLEIYETDFLKERMGLSENDYDKLCDRSLSIIHCASDTSFTEKERGRVMKSNVESLNEILYFACKSRVRAFHFISTAYAAGTDSIECAEAPVTSVHFTNVYEESKALAEKLVVQMCRENDIPFTIIRPSIVYGDSVTGRSLKFNALYYPVRFLKHIRDIYTDDIKNNNGIKAKECGIYLNEAGTLHLPIRIFIHNEGKINLIPIDYFTNTLLSILDNPVTDIFYHITSNKPENMMRLASYTERFLNISGLEVVTGQSGADEMRNPPEELYDYFIKAYRPYISDRRVFIRENTNYAAGSSLPPDFSYEIFERCMSYAVSAGWGKNF